MSVGTNVVTNVDIKNQYHHRHGYDSRLKSPTKKINHIITPLTENSAATISFKGLNFLNPNKYIIKRIPKGLTKKVFQSLKEVSSQQFEYYSKIREEYVNLIKTDKEFRNKYGFSEDAAEKISCENLYYIPQKELAGKLLSNVVKPFTSLYHGVKKLFASKNAHYNQRNKEYERVINNFSSLEGLINSHEIWENGYRSLSGHGKWTDTSDFLIPEDVLLSKIKRRRNKVVDPDKGKYSTTSLMLGNRFISGLVYAYFLGTDAYNTTMRFSNNKDEASIQRKSRIAQEFSRIGLNMYIQNLLFGTFETAVNKSLSTALFVSGSTVAFSEILGRKLVGKPIMPSDKETLDKLEKEMEAKKGVLPAVGRLLTRVKTNRTTLPNSYKYTKANTTAFSQFSKNNSTPSFKGLYSSTRLFEKKSLIELLNIIKQADEKQFEYIKINLIKSVKKSDEFAEILKSIKNSDPNNDLLKLKEINLDNKENIEKAFNLITNSELLKELPLGTKKNFHGQVIKSVLMPLHFLKNSAQSIKNFAANIYYRFSSNQLSANLSKMEKTLSNPKFKEAKDFKDFYEKRLQLKAWSESNFSDAEKKVRIFEEFMKILSKETEEIEGLKNIILWIDKQIAKAGIKVQEDGKLSAKDLEKLRKIMQDSVMKADSAKHVEYDGNKVTQTNINLARAITTLFLVTDAYNLTMQYSNDNKKEANISAKNRAAQEISRICFSAYILAFVHNLLSKLCNSSLAGAFSLTAITSILNDSVSRSIVGVPLKAKNQQELKEIDIKNAKSKSPIKKALTYSMKNSSKTTPAAKQDYFSNEFFINPKI